MSLLRHMSVRGAHRSFVWLPAAPQCTSFTTGDSIQYRVQEGSFHHAPPAMTMGGADAGNKVSFFMTAPQIATAAPAAMLKM